MVQVMLMKKDWVVENDVSEHKWMSSGQQSANDQRVFEEADHFCVPSSRFLTVPPAEDDATH